MDHISVNINFYIFYELVKLYENVFKKLSTFQMIILGFAGVILAGSPYFDASVFNSGKCIGTIYGYAVHFRFGSLRYRTNRSRYRYILVRLWSGSNTDSYSNRRIRSCFAATSIALSQGKKINLKQRSTMQGSPFCTSGWRYCKTNGFHNKK